LNLHLCYSTSEDRFPLPAHIRDFYGPFGFPDAPADRPYITSNFVTGLDGRASFREIRGRAGGKEISRSREDAWMMNFLRAHHDAQLMGANTLREEPGLTPGGWDYGIDEEELAMYRATVLRLGRQRVIIVSSGDLDLMLKVFNSQRVEPWILTTEAGSARIAAQLKQLAHPPEVTVVAVGSGERVDFSTACQILRKQYGIRTLLCEGGPAVYSEFLRRQLVDEEFRTISFQVIGESTQKGITRPTPYGNISYTPELAPWFKLISLHYSLPHHVFLRLRYEGTLPFAEEV
jgi:riboflavin biosynthesis pyrimidine reductase